MSIVSLVKVTTYGMMREKAQVLRDLQEFGCLHLMALNPTKEVAKRSGPSSEAREALRFLLDCPNRRKQVRDPAKFDAVQIEREALRLKAKMNALEDERDMLMARIATLKPWGEFTFPPLAELKNHRLWFYLVPHRQMKFVEAAPLIWEIVKGDSRFCYVVVISEHEPEGMPVPRVRTGSRSAADLERSLEAIEIELEDVHAERASLSRWAYLYSHSLTHLENLAARDEAAQQTYDDEKLFALQAWMPEREIARIEAYARQMGMALEIDAPAPDETPPTLLEEPSFFAMGKDLVLFYMTPGYRLWDPSIVVFFSFALFFAMILGDAGYAALLGAFLAWKWRRFGRTDGGVKFRILLSVIVGMSLLWGVLSGSYFGMSPKEGSYMAALHVLDVNDFSVMMKLSIFIGVLHLLIGNAGAYWCRRTSPERWSPVGWGALILGGFLFWIGSAGQGVMLLVKLLGLGLMVGGGGLALWFGAIHPVWWKRLLGGMNATLPRLSGAFGDALSYMRLFALGLAGSSLSATFNSLGAQADAVPGIGLLFAILIVSFGHALNFGLSLMGSVIHGLRLNYIEFFNWALSEEGHLFKAFALKKEKTSWKE